MSLVKKIVDHIAKSYVNLFLSPILPLKNGAIKALDMTLYF